MIHCTLLNRAISSGVENRESTYSFSGMKPWRFDAIRRGFKQQNHWKKPMEKNHERKKHKITSCQVATNQGEGHQHHHRQKIGESYRQI